MATAAADLPAALSALQVRWGDAAPRAIPAVVGALAIDPLPDPDPGPITGLEPSFRTGFAALDAVLGPAGVPRSGSMVLAGTGSAGVTTLALRLVAEAQAAGAIVGWVDGVRGFDPLEAAARGVRMDWLAVLVPSSLDEALAMTGDLLAARTVDVAVLDLPVRRGRRAAVTARIDRLTAIARRAGALVVVIEPDPGSVTGGDGTGGTIVEGAHLRLELHRRGWIRRGREVVGIETDALIARNRRGPPGRRAGLRILYAEGGDRDACLRRDDLLDGTADHTTDDTMGHPDATPPPLLATPPAPPGAGAVRSVRLLPHGAGRPGRAAVDGRTGHRRESGGTGSGRSPRDAAGRRAPAGARGDLPRSPA
jgi:RecA/RadA recombinase